MEKNKRYSSTIKSKPLLYIETKKLAQLIIKGFNEVQIKEQILEQNLFQVKTESRKRELSSGILIRLKALDEFLIKQILKSDVGTSKLLVLYSILKTDRLFFEFMNEVFFDKISFHDLVLTDRDFNLFFEAKRQQSDIIARWKDYTFYKLQQVYIRILFESGLLKNQKSVRKINKPMMPKEIIDHLRQEYDPKFIKVLVGD